MNKDVSNTAFGFAEEDTTNKTIEKEAKLLEKINEEREVNEVNGLKELRDEVSKKINKDA